MPAQFTINARERHLDAYAVLAADDAVDSIWLARLGMARLLSQLRPQDRFAIVAFGSEAQSHSPCMLVATEWNLDAAQAWVRALGADMGGTEMATALEAAFA